MPPVIDDTETLEHTATCDTTHAPTLPRAPWRGRSPLLAGIARIVTALWSRPPQEPRGVSRSQFELPLDRLAREHPDLYLRVLSGIG